MDVGSKVGLVVKQPCGLNAEIVKVIDYKNVFVRFEDGEICKNTSEAFKGGRVRHSSSYPIEDMCAYIRLGDERYNSSNSKYRVVGFDGDNVIVSKVVNSDDKLTFAINKIVYEFGNFDDSGRVVDVTVRELISVGDRRTNRCGEMAEIESICDDYITVCFFITGHKQVVNINYVDWYCHTFYHPKSSCYRYVHSKIGVGFYWYIPNTDYEICRIVATEQSNNGKRTTYILQYNGKKYRLGQGAVQTCLKSSPFLDMNLIANKDEGKNSGYKGHDRLGSTVTFKNGLVGTLVAYRKSTDIDIRLSDDTLLQHVNYSIFKDGYDIQYQMQSYKRGDKILARDGKTVTVLDYRSTRSMDIITEDNVVFKDISFWSVKNGYLGLSDEEKLGIRLSKTYYNNAGVPFKIINWLNYDNVEVEFLDGARVTNTYNNICDGSFSHPTLILSGLGAKVGSTFGKLDIIKLVSKLNKPGYIYYQCKCRDCNEEFILTPTKMLAHKC